MKIVVGLGNPGDKYFGTRHNVGFEVLAELSKRWGGAKPKSRFEAEISEISLPTGKSLLVAPQTYMNLSGRSVQQVVRFFQVPVSEVLVICDDMNLRVGQVRLRASGSAGGQNGMQSVITCMGTSEISRLRIGVGRPPANISSTDHVLGRFRKEETDFVEKSIERAANAVEVWAAEGIVKAMNEFNGDGGAEPHPKPNDQPPRPG